MIMVYLAQRDFPGRSDGKEFSCNPGDLGSILGYNSPKHFVVSHVLHRLLVPRHPPCALINLTLFWSLDLKLIKSQRFGLFLVTIYNSIS